jgi:hypothetical protein
MKTPLTTAIAVLLGTALPTPAAAEEPAAEEPAAEIAPAAEADAEIAPAAEAEADAPRPRRPAPYALPWQLRPIAPGRVVRSDTAIAAYSTDAGDGTTIASTFLVSYPVGPQLAPLARVAVVREAAPGGAEASTLSNPLLGVAWGRALAPGWRLAGFGAVTLPVGSGGGNAPNPERSAAQRAAIPARSAMDNALFAVNDLTVIGGAGLAYLADGLTVQAEVTVLQLNRVRGADAQADRFKTNFTSGLFAGYFPLPWLSVGAELRYQRWLSTPAAVAADPTGAARDTLTAAAGVRGHVQLAGRRWLRPGIAYARGLDDPMRGRGYHIVQLDVPLAF